MMIEETTVDGHGCVSGDKDDRMLIDEAEYGLNNSPFNAWRKVMWRTVSLFILYRLRFVSGVVWSTLANCKIKFD